MCGDITIAVQITGYDDRNAVEFLVAVHQTDHRAGANVIVAGSAVFGADTKGQAAAFMKILNEQAKKA